MYIRLYILCFLFSGLCVSAQQFTIDFNQWVDNPLVKTKLGVYQPPLAQAKNLIPSHELLPELNISQYRYEYGWGKESSLDYEQISKLNNSIQYKIDKPNNQVDQVFVSLRNKGVKPMFVHGYAPTYLQQYFNWQSMVNNLNDWQLINKKYAEHWKLNGLKAPYYEIWNAPDMYNVFFIGSRDEYNQLYQYGATGIKQGDPDAQIGGISSWLDFEFMGYWLDFVIKNNLPLDFVSIHAYEKWQWNIDNTRQELMQRKLDFLPIYLTEWMSFSNTNPQETALHGPIEKTVAAVKFFQDINNFNKQHDLAQVYWAQWRDGEWLEDEGWTGADDKVGLITLENQRKPLFNAFKLYSWMPVDRYASMPDSSEGTFVLASRDNNNAAVLVYNTTKTAKEVNLKINNLPFAAGKSDVFRLDNQHGSIRECGDACENNLAAGPSTTFKGNSYTWKGELPAYGICMVKLSDLSGMSMLTNKTPGQAKHIRSYYSFKDRTNDCYADFDTKTFIARLGSGSDVKTYAVTANVIEDIPAKIKVQGAVSQDPKMAFAKAQWGIRVDYQLQDGSYGKSVYFYDPSITKPFMKEFAWGTKREVDMPVQISGILSPAGAILDIAGNAPEAWNNQRVILTFLLIDSNTHVQTRMQLMNAQ